MKKKITAWLLFFSICIISLPVTEYAEGAAEIKMRKEDMPTQKTEDPVAVIEVSDLDSFAEAAVIDTAENHMEVLPADNPWQKKRLLVISDGEFDSVGAESMICGYNNMYVLDYASEAETKAAYQGLKKNPDLIVDADISYDTAAKENRENASGNENNISSASKHAEKMSGERNICVAVLDTGYDINCYGEKRIVSAVDLTASQTVQDENGHGTAMANIILEHTPDNVFVMPVKTADKSGCTSSLELYMGICYAIEHHADIINISMSAYKPSASQIIREAVCAAKQAGIIVVVSAGNAKGNVCDFSPADIEEAVAVSAVTEHEVIADYSNYGAAVDYCAYGTIEVLGRNGKKVKQEGTSVAAAIVSAAAAEQKAKNKNSTYEELLSRLNAQAKDLGEKGRDELYGQGLLLPESVKPVQKEENENVSKLLACDWKNIPVEILNGYIGKATHMERKVFLDRLSEKERGMILAMDTLFSEKVIYSENIFDEKGNTTETFRVEGILYDIVRNDAFSDEYEVQAQKYHVYAYGSNTGARSCIKLDTDANDNDAVIYCWMKDRSSDNNNSGEYGITFVSGKSAYDFNKCTHGIENCDAADNGNPVVWRLKIKDVKVSKPENMAVNYDSDLWSKSTFKITGNTVSGYKAHYWYIYNYQVSPASDADRKKAYGDGGYHGGFWDLKDASGKKCGSKTITTTVDIGSRDLYADERKSGITYRLPLIAHKNKEEQKTVTDAEASCISKGYRHVENTYTCSICDKIWQVNGAPQEIAQLTHNYAAKTASDNGIQNGKYWEECTRSCGGTDAQGAYWQRNVKYLQPVRYWEMNTDGSYSPFPDGIERNTDYYEARAAVPKWSRTPSEEFLPGFMEAFSAPDRAVYHDVYIPRKQYRICYNGNGATGGSTKPQTVYCGAETVLSENGFKRTGYEFVGWSKTAGGKAIDTKTVKNLSLIHNQIVTLYAVWKPQVFEILLDNQGAEEKPGTAAIYEKYGKGYYADAKASKKFPLDEIQIPQKTIKDNTLTGGVRKQQFLGYYTAKHGTGKLVTDKRGFIIAYINGSGKYEYFKRNSTVYAGWEDMYAVQFDPNLSEEEMEILKRDGDKSTYETPVVCPYTRWKAKGEEITVSFAEPVMKNKKWKKFYRFLGWSLTPEISSRDEIILSENQCALTFVKDEDVTLYAQWDTGFLTAYMGNKQSEGADFLERAEKMAAPYVFAENKFVREESMPTVDIATGKTKQKSGEPYTETVPCRFLGWSLAGDEDRQAEKDIFPEKDKNRTGMELILAASEIMEEENGEGITFGVPAPAYGCSTLTDASVNDNQSIVTDETMPFVNLYAVWDQYPRIQAADLYLPLSDAKEGVLTEDYLLSLAVALDRELESDTNAEGIMKKGEDKENQTSFTILDYQMQDFTEAESEMSLTITYCARDAAGNVTKKKVHVYLVDTSGEEYNTGSVRFISPEHMDTLAENSVWRTGEYAKKLAWVLGNKKTEEEYTEVTPVQKALGIKSVVKPGSGTWDHVQEIWEFTHEEVLDIQAYVENKGVGSDPFEFLEKFKHCQVM